MNHDYTLKVIILNLNHEYNIGLSFFYDKIINILFIYEEEIKKAFEI